MEERLVFGPPDTARALKYIGKTGRFSDSLGIARAGALHTVLGVTPAYLAEDGRPYCYFSPDEIIDVQPAANLTMGVITREQFDKHVGEFDCNLSIRNKVVADALWESIQWSLAAVQSQQHTPATLEQIERVLLDDNCTTYIDGRKLRRVAELVQPLTVAQLAHVPATPKQIVDTIIQETPFEWDDNDLRVIAKAVQPLTVAQPSLTIDWKDLPAWVTHARVVYGNHETTFVSGPDDEWTLKGRFLPGKEGAVRPAPKPRARTTAELLTALLDDMAGESEVQAHEGKTNRDSAAYVVARALADGATLRGLCENAGVSLEVAE